MGSFSVQNRVFDSPSGDSVGSFGRLFFAFRVVFSFVAAWFNEARGTGATGHPATCREARGNNVMGDRRLHECDAYDLDPDGDVDLADFAVFQALFAGSRQPRLQPRGGVP
jgi:hypothetical protein